MIALIFGFASEIPITNPNRPKKNNIYGITCYF